MKLAAVVFVGTLVCLPNGEGARAEYANPFSSAEAIRAERGDLPSATMVFKYEFEQTEPSTRSVEAIYVASDWASIEVGDEIRLLDFRLGRIFTIVPAKKTFTSLNLDYLPYFLVMERQNRFALSRALGAAGIAEPDDGKLLDGCSAESQLGVAIPSLKDAVEVSVVEKGGLVTLTCNGRVAGRFEPGSGAPPPAAFWPMLAATMPMHPALRAVLAKTGLAPRRIETGFQQTGPATVTWRLASAEKTSRAYPMESDFANATSDLGDSISPGLGQLAEAAVAGTASDGATTLATWDVYLKSLARQKGAASAGMALVVTIVMFPQTLAECQSGRPLYACELLGGLRASIESEPVLRAYFSIMSAEQDGKPLAAIDLMAAVQSAPGADDPILGQAFALALLAGGADAEKQAKARGLPSDPFELEVAAVRAYPYNPNYWVDLGQLLGRRWSMEQLMFAVDVAASLPVPGAGKDSPLVRGSIELFERIRRDFPDYYLPQ